MEPNLNDLFYYKDIIGLHFLFIFQDGVCTSIRMVTQKIKTSAINAHSTITIDYQLSTINYQLSTINYQLSTINYQLSTINYQLSTLNSQLSTLNSQLSTLN
jgi:hypothetical protein